MNIVGRLKARAREVGARIVLPEGDDPRVQDAAVQLAHEGLVTPILLTLAPDELPEMLSEVVVIEPTADPRFESFVQAYVEKRKHKGMTAEKAAKIMGQTVPFGAMLVARGDADGCVAGATHATSDVLRAGLQIIGMAEGVSVASSSFLMILPDGRPLTYGDCGMVPNPNAEQLSQIALATAKTHELLTGEEPVVAMLSFSTKGSAKHPDVDKVRTATELAQAAAPDMAIDGELQFDAAWVASIGERKAPGSNVVGRANVFIFPTLDAGNIAYKITERLGNAQALGPLIQGLARPMHDLSRGCQAEDIFVVSLISAIQARS